VASLDLAHSSITEVVEDELHATTTEERQQIEALVADTEMARLLEIPIGAPVLFISRWFKVNNGDEFMLFRSYYRADRYRYTMDFTARGKASRKTRNAKPAAGRKT
jgi:GntR family transcriptional regulator